MSEGSGFGSSGGSYYEPCPSIAWEYSRSEEYHGTVTIHSETDVEYRVSPSTEPEIGGYVNDEQWIDMSGVMFIPAGKRVVMDWTVDLTTETENAGFDSVEIYRNQGGVPVEQIALESTEEGGGAEVEVKNGSGQMIWEGDGTNNNGIGIYFTTVDGQWHTAQVGFRFKITSCYMEDI